MKITKKAQAYQLFSEGKIPSSPEVKALGLPVATRHTYYDGWKKKNNPQKPPASSVPLPGGESVSPIAENVKSSQGEQKEGVPQRREVDELEEMRLADEEIAEGGVREKEIEPKTEKVEAPFSTDDSKKKIPTTILGEGLKVTVFLSIRTLALYQIAYSTQAQHDGEGELSLGEFLDTCAEDFFRVRGKTLGLIVGGK